VGLAGVSPASRHPAGRMPAGPTAKMAVLQNFRVFSCLARRSLGRRRVLRGQIVCSAKSKRGAALIDFAYLDSLQRRTAKPHRDFIGAVGSARVAYFVGVTHVPPSDTNEVLIGPVVGYCRDHYSITVYVDIG